MTNTELLERKIKEKGLKKSFLAEKIGLSKAGFRNCCTNKSDFKATHIKILCEVLEITDLSEKESIFFGANGA